MTEAEWLAYTDPQKMLEYLQGKASDRKLRLFAVACCRRVWPLLTDGRSCTAVAIAERYADEDADDEELHFAITGAADAAEALEAFSISAGREAEVSAAHAALNVIAVSAERAADYCAANVGSAVYHTIATNRVLSAAAARDAERAEQTDLLRDIFGNPFAHLNLSPSWLTWNDGVVVRLAQAAYEERCLPEGTLDKARLAVLADALEEAGCADAEVLAHLRQPRLHVRGCWLVDSCRGRS